MSRTYAVGDIHGCHSELARLFDAIEAHAAGSPYKIVCLGDYVDKGENSAGVLDVLMRWPQRSNVPLVCIKGNHEAVMAAAAEDGAAEAKWKTMHSAAVLAQYDVRRAADLPSDVLGWLHALPTFCNDGLRYFVHAGVDPALPLSAQTDVIRMSMRGAFLSEDHDFGRHIVHGHTPLLNGEPELRPFRTNLDTNVTQTGRLTAAMFDDSAGGPAAILVTTPAGKVEIREMGACWSCHDASSALAGIVPDDFRRGRRAGISTVAVAMLITTSIMLVTTVLSQRSLEQPKKVSGATYFLNDFRLAA